MAHKQILFRSAAREKILRGASQLADAVRVTLGPRSKSVLIQKKWGTPIVCNDRVTIAKEVDLKNPGENLGAQMLRQAAERTGEAVSDGTSTATVLAQDILTDGMRNVAAGASAVELKRGLDRGTPAVIEALRGLSRPVCTRAERAQVAIISAHNDTEIGELVADAMERMGPEGVITVEEAKTTETVFEDAQILVTGRKISAVKDLIPLLEQVEKAGRPMLVVAEDVEGNALASMILNHIRGTLRTSAVKAPGFGNRPKSMLQDIAVLTGGEVVSEELGLKLEAASLPQLGRAQRLVVDKDATTIVGGGQRWDIEVRIEQIRREIDRTTSDYDREKLQERLAKLVGGVAVARMLDGSGNVGFDAAMVDPTKVVRVALENAVSVAGVLLLTKATMTDLPEEPKPRAAEPEIAM